MKLKNKFFSALLLTQFFLIDSSFAKVMTLSEVTQAAVKQNLNIKEKLIESHQSQQTVQYNRLSLLPKIDLYSIVNTGGSFFGLAGLIEDIAPFLIPANWFRQDEAEISLSFQKKSYKALWGNEVFEARSMYLTMVSDSKSLAVFDSYQKDLAELQDLAETRDQFGGDRLGALEMLLAQKSGEIIFLLDKDYTICNLHSNNMEAVKIFGDFLLSNCIGNSHDTHVLLSLLNIPHKDVRA